MSKVHKGDLAGARVTLDGADVTDSLVWVDVAQGRALLSDGPGQARFAKGVFLIEREAVAEQSEEEVTLIEVEDDVTEPVAEEKIDEAQPEGIVRSRRRSTRSRS